MRVIRAFVREDYETARYRSVNDELLEKNLTTVRVFSNNFPFVFLFANLGTLAIVWFGGLAGDRRQAHDRGARRLQHLPRLPALPDPHDRLPRREHLARRGLISARLRGPRRAARGRGRPRRLPLPPISCRVEFDDVTSATPADEREILPASASPPSRARPWPSWGRRAPASPRSSTSSRASTT